ncbi:3-oxoacyl-[acyl-carrier-protein] reductase [Ornithobacterium rhinotracheale]|uniref:3-oxoacyl-[acyl-carrier-protein] reductase n=1 Tax=Ornithobacterium rhinotracheale TaxID=28251 RepID=UPI00129C4F14|nr:3-oxoacyl-[acyl-carrier-protein] reductase [Ornithobacterium rhinotracheale]MRJ08581.1 3-oxoacyl-[acyl-carrier-protein] reductase [Ornithobacterium rhinotracheale]UOH76972.1 3-oxoacyl-[acyl-carrier-protein] reductase [Ornithobacterium rhinotracheale]
MELLKGKVAIVTGATRGIGKGILEKFVENGAKVAFTYASSAEAAKALEEKYGESVKGFQSDASDFDAAQELVNQVLKTFGQIDVVVNNAGITKDNLLMRMGYEDWEKVIKVNLDSAFNLTKAVLRPMLKQRSGSIINMSSVVGLQGNAGQANYSASKAGLLGFTKSVALELGSRNIRCNAIAPGFIETEMTAKLDEKVVEEWRNNIPLRRGGTPEDIANACLYLGSELSSYVTGQVLSVDGGMHT